jgi:DNA-sulfur modification-associated
VRDIEGCKLKVAGFYCNANHMFSIRKLFSLSALYDANEELLKNLRVSGDKTHDAMNQIAVEFWAEVAKAIPAWQKVKNGDLKALELRQESISSHAVVLRALGAVGADLLKDDPNGWKARVSELGNVDWSKKNKDWEGVCIIANSVVSNRQARLATKAYIKMRLKLPLNDAEIRSLALSPDALTLWIRTLAPDDQRAILATIEAKAEKAEANAYPTTRSRALAGYVAARKPNEGQIAPPNVHRIHTSPEVRTRAADGIVKSSTVG